MKKLQALVISLLFLITNNIQASFLQGPNPYSFGPQGRTVSDLRDFAKPKNMVKILPNRPVVATDSEGNRVYYTPDGKMTVSISKGGAMSFSLSGLTKSYNSDGELTGTTRTLRGSGLFQEIRDSENRVIGFNTLNSEGKVHRTYDKDMNLTATYFYTGQGARKDYVQNEMTGGKTYFDKYERRKYETDFEGHILKTYLYADVEYTVDENDNERKTLKETETKNNPTNTGLATSIRAYTHNMYSANREGNSDINSLVYEETFFDLEGKTLYVKNADGFITREFHYKQDEQGNKIMDYHFDKLTKTKTYYDKHEKPDYVLNDKGFMVTKYYDGYTVNFQADRNYAEVTKYDIDGKELYTTLKNIEYNDDGTIKKVMDKDDKVLQEYFYKKDAEGNKVINYVVNHSNDGKDTLTYTWYEDGKPMYITDTEERPTDYTASNIIKEYHWTGDILNCVSDRKTGEVQWYNMNKELVCESMNERLISKNIYSNGQLVGKWDAQNGKVTLYTNERAWIEVYSDFEPTPEMVTAILTHSADIETAIAVDEANNSFESENSEVKKVLNKLMKDFGWGEGPGKRFLTRAEQ